jgi:hypothetical protein
MSVEGPERSSAEESEHLDGASESGFHDLERLVQTGGLRKDSA